MVSLLHCLVLTVATGAVGMDLRTGRIDNGWILASWLAGLLTQIFRYGVMGIALFLPGAAIPILCLYWLFWFRMLGAGDIKLLSALGGFLGAPEILKVMLASFLIGAILSLSIILVCGNLLQRLTVFFHYFQTYFQRTLYGRITEPVPYRDGKWGVECLHFSVPIFLGILLWAGGLY